MAYAFEKILNTMDNKIDVFGQQQGAGGQSQGGGQPQQQQGGETKTSTDGDVGSGGSSGSASGGASATVAPNFTGSAQAAFQAAQSQPMSSFKPLKDVGAKIAANDTALQTEANDYVKGQAGKQTYDVSNEDIDKAVGGDVETAGKVGGLVSQKIIKPVDAFTPKTDINAPEIERFKSEPGLTSYFRSQYGPSYSRGQAQFDIGRLQSDPKFFEGLRGLEGQQQDLGKKMEGYYASDTGLAAEAAKTGQANLTKAQEAAKLRLKALSGGLETGNTKEMTDFQAEIDKMNKDPAYRASKVGDGVKDPGIQTGIAQAIATNPELAKHLTPEVVAAFGLNPADFADVYKDPLNSDMFYDQGEADRFNRINTMLGVGGAGKVAGSRPGAAATFNKDKYLQEVLTRGTAANETANTGAKATIKRIMDAISGRKNENVAKSKSVNYDEMRDNMKNALVGKYSRQGRDLAGLQGVDINQFFKGGFADNLQDDDFVSDADVGELNAAYDELMDPTRASAGRYGNTSFNPSNYTFDNQGYEDALSKIGFAGETPQAPAPEPTPNQQGPSNWETSPNKVLAEAAQIAQQTGGGSFLPQAQNALNTGIKTGIKTVRGRR